MECEGDYVSISENECADIAMGMIPLAWNEGVGEDIEEVLDMAVVNNYKTLIFPSKEESKRTKEEGTKAQKYDCFRSGDDLQQQQRGEESTDIC